MAEKERGKWGVLYMMSFAMFIMTIDMTMMNVSISALVRDLNTTVSGIQLAIALYTLVMAAFMIVGAKMADIWGTKKVFVVGLAIYTIGTTMATFAPNLLILLVGWSIFEGIGGAMMMPVTVTYITKDYTGKDRIFAFGVWGAIAGAAAAFGPIIGGVFTTYLTWRLGFGMEAIIAIGMFAKMGILKDYQPTHKIKLDILGALLVGVGLFLITLSVLLIDPLGDAPVIGVLSLGILVIVGFVYHEKNVVRKGLDPLVNLKLFKSKTFVVGNLVSIFFQITLAGLMFTLPVFLQNVANYNAMSTGLSLVPLSIMMFIFSIYGQKLLKYMTAKRVIQLGIVFAFVGLLLLFIVFSPTTTGWDLIWGLAFYGTGLGLIFSQITNLAMAGASPEEEAEASGVFNSQKQLGMSLGTAFIGAVLVLGMINNIARGIYESNYFPGYSKEEIKQKVIDWIVHMKQGQIVIPPDYMQHVNQIVQWALGNAMRSAMIFLMISLAIGAIFSIWLPNNPEKS
ncbi:transporter, major facilitator family [Aciduliprofundum boonei T469]|nr:transporter, major facilitator family [Aciduliprofundum boonei T469]